MNTSIQLPLWCVDIVANPPRSGEGFHNWLFRAARALWKCGRTANDIRAVLENAAEICGRHVPTREIDNALRNSRSSAVCSTRFQHQPWPSLNAEQRKAVIESGAGLVELWEASPVRLEDNESHTEEIIDVLFPGDPLLCAGRSNSDFDTRSREEWRGELSDLQLIVPNPMTAWTGLTQEGKESTHALSIIGPRRFLVIEQDKGTIDEQAAILPHLATIGQMAVAVYSGSKSIHGWFYCVGRPEDKLHDFMRYAVSLGADDATWPRSQFVRIPDGTRAGSKSQTVYFFRPEVIK